MSTSSINQVRVRIAPSPTGALHIGTARAALFNYLYARAQDGVFVLRIEDTDVERSDPKFEKNIIEGLRWLDILWDEGPIDAMLNENSTSSQTTNHKLPTTNSHGPYRQSERGATYRAYIQKLLDSGRAFYCFHSEKELLEERDNLMAMKRPVLHLCEFRTMEAAEAQIAKETKPDCIIRFKTPPGRVIQFRDLIRGDVCFESDLLGDFSIAKNNDTPLYNFAVIVDDEEMAISHVIRGEDHISNTPKQILLIEALGFKTPQYAHLPLILGPDRSKLSKRHGATSVDEYRKAGYLPEALFNFIALLGWNPGSDREIYSRDEIVAHFSLERVQKSGAVFDVGKLDWMNGEYIRRKSATELIELCLPFLEERGFIKKGGDRNYLEKIVLLEQPRMKKLSEIGERTDFFFREPKYDAPLLRWKGMTDNDVRESLQKSKQLLGALGMGVVESKNIEKIFFEAIGERDKGTLLWPLRVALTGKKASPGPFEIIEIMGIDAALKCIDRALGKLTT
ncbi:MAG: glutamate--tRNA ligase [Patescibacteria group bacterium]